MKDIDHDPDHARDAQPDLVQSIRQVTIGAAIRFELPEELLTFCRELSEAAHNLDRIAECEVLFCANGANPQTREFLQVQADMRNAIGLPFRLIESPPGKIQAHRAIARERDFLGAMLFVDADVRIEPDTFVNLYRALNRSRTARVAYAEVEAILPESGGVLQRLQRAYYHRRDQLPPRKFLHGRCFLLRQWEPAFTAVLAPRKTCHAIRHLNLENGPMVDDIYYSRVLCNQYGAHSILRVPSARVAFTPPESWSELYRDAFRTEYELARLAILDPGGNAIQRKHFQSRSNHRGFFSVWKVAGLSSAVYLLVEAAMRFRGFLGIRFFRESPSCWGTQGNNHHAG